MGRSTSGLGRKPGKTRVVDKCPGLKTEGTTAHDAAADRRASEQLLNLTKQSPAPAAALRGSSPSTLKAAASKYHRVEVARLKEERDHNNDLRNAANQRARLAEEREERAKALAATRLKERDEACESQRSWRKDLHEIEDEMEGLASERRVSDLPVIGKAKRGVGGGKGRDPWPLWMIQLIIEKLILGIPPASIPDDIILQDRLTTGRDGQEVPSIHFCQDMRIVLRILTETLAAYQLAQQKQWHQLFTDGTSRRQIALETLLIGMSNAQEGGVLTSEAIGCAWKLERYYPASHSGIVYRLCRLRKYRGLSMVVKWVNGIV